MIEDFDILFFEGPTFTEFLNNNDLEDMPAHDYPVLMNFLVSSLDIPIIAQALSKAGNNMLPGSATCEERRQALLVVCKYYLDKSK